MTLDSRSRWLALVIVCLGDLMIVLDVTIVGVALPSIREDLGFSESSLAWVVNAYLLTFGGFLLLGGRFGDLARLFPDLFDQIAHGLADCRLLVLVEAVVVPIMLGQAHCRQYDVVVNLHHRLLRQVFRHQLVDVEAIAEPMDRMLVGRAVLAAGRVGPQSLRLGLLLRGPLVALHVVGDEPQQSLGVIPQRRLGHRRTLG